MKKKTTNLIYWQQAEDTEHIVFTPSHATNMASNYKRYPILKACILVEYSLSKARYFSLHLAHLRRLIKAKSICIKNGSSTSVQFTLQ